MPFKTAYGTYYHMTKGCHGAEIPCETDGLEPCALCCSTEATQYGAGGGHVPKIVPSSPSLEAHMPMSGNA